MGESSTTAVQTYEDLLAQYGYQHLADNLPEVPLKSLANEANEIDITGTGSSH